MLSHSSFNPNINRRSALRAGLGAAVLAAAAPWQRALAASDGPTLLSWPGYGQPYLVEPFEKANGVKVQSKEYVGGDQMMALLSQSPFGTYDVVLASTEDLSLLKKADLIDELDPSDYPLSDFWPEFREVSMNTFDGKMYGVIGDFAFLGLAYNTDAFKPADLESYEALWSEKAKGKVGFFDFYLPAMGCISLASGNPSPFDIDGAAFGKLRDKMLSLNGQVAGFYTIADIFSSLSNGQAHLIPGIGEWVTLGLRASGVPVNTLIPREGGLQISQSFGIVKGSNKRDAARKLIQYFLSAEGQVRVATVADNMKLVPNRAGWKLLNDTMPDKAALLNMRLDGPNAMNNFKAGRIVPRQLPQQQSIEEWNDVWNELKSA